MGRPKKPVRDMTSDELAKRLFPDEVVKEAKKVAHERDNAGEKTTEKPRKNK